MPHPLQEYARAVSDETDLTYAEAITFVGRNIAKARTPAVAKIRDHQIRISTIIANLVDLAKGIPLEMAEAE